MNGFGQNDEAHTNYLVGVVKANGSGRTCEADLFVFVVVQAKNPGKQGVTREIVKLKLCSRKSAL